MQQEPNLSNQTSSSADFNKKMNQKFDSKKKVIAQVSICFFLALSLIYLGYKQKLENRLNQNIALIDEYTSDNTILENLEVSRVKFASKPIFDKDDWDKFFITTEQKGPYERNLNYINATNVIFRYITVDSIQLNQDNIDTLKYAYNKILENTEARLSEFTYDSKEYPQYIEDIGEFGTHVKNLDNPFKRVESINAVNSHFETSIEVNEKKSSYTSLQKLMTKMAPIKTFLDDENLILLSKQIKEITATNHQIFKENKNKENLWEKSFSEKFGTQPANWFILLDENNATKILVKTDNKSQKLSALLEDIKSLKLVEKNSIVSNGQ